MASDSIWFKKDLNSQEIIATILNGVTMGTHLGMQFVEMGNDFLKMSMPVDERTKQPYGLLHGGASCALAETVGSIASALVIDTTKQICVGLEINANHLRGAKDGIVIATASPLHIGNSTHVWDIKIHDETQNLICVSRLTVAILRKK
jgi:1,4-dihydroxy-2-naphthoyl-CoA hydrolase